MLEKDIFIDGEVGLPWPLGAMIWQDKAHLYKM